VGEVIMTGVSIPWVSIRNRGGRGGWDSGVSGNDDAFSDGNGGTLGSSTGSGSGGTSAIESSGTVGNTDGVSGVDGMSGITCGKDPAASRAAAATAAAVLGVGGWLSAVIKFSTTFDPAS